MQSEGSNADPEVQKLEIDVLSSRFIQRATSVFSSLGDDKVLLLESIGFGGTRLIGERKYIDDQLSMWLLSIVDTDKMTMVSPGLGHNLPMKPRDVHLTLGLPYQGVDVDDSSNVPEATMSAVRAKLFLKKSGEAITVEYLEHVLLKDYSNDMAADEEEAFKIAAVLYSMNCLYAVDHRRPCIPIGILNFVANTREIRNVNWCSYILKYIKKAAMSVQHGISIGSRYFCIPGCMLWLQIYFLDNLDFGFRPKPVFLVPRVAEYGPEKVRNLITIATEEAVFGKLNSYGLQKVRMMTEVGYSREEDGDYPSSPSSGVGLAQPVEHANLTDAVADEPVKLGSLVNVGRRFPPFAEHYNRRRRAEQEASTDAACNVRPKLFASTKPRKGHRSRLPRPTPSRLSVSYGQPNRRAYNYHHMVILAQNAPKKRGTGVSEDISIEDAMSSCHLDVLQSDGVVSMMHKEQNVHENDNRGANAEDVHPEGSAGQSGSGEVATPGVIADQVGPHLTDCSDGEPGDHALQDAAIACDGDVPTSIEGSQDGVLKPVRHGVKRTSGRVRMNLFSAMKRRLVLRGESSNVPPPSTIETVEHLSMAKTTEEATIHAEPMRVWNEEPGGPGGLHPYLIEAIAAVGDMEIDCPAPHSSHCSMGSMVVSVFSDPASDSTPDTVNENAQHGFNSGALDLISDVIDSDVFDAAVDEAIVKPPVTDGRRELTEEPDHQPSPFDLGLYSYAADRKASRQFSRAIDRLADNQLDSVWYHSATPWAISMTGRDIISQLGRRGHFSIALCDAFMRLYQSMDDLEYGPERKRWRCFLPARFADAVLRGEPYLEMESIRKCFIGEHLRYDFEHVRQVILPVPNGDKWSCYIFDMSAFDLLVLDPTMQKRPYNVAEQEHSRMIKLLTQALINCTHHFFRGWNVPRLEDWYSTAYTDISDGCRLYNSGVFAIHYARWYEGLDLHERIKGTDLIDIRGEMRYQLLVSSSNYANLPLGLEI